MFFFNLTHSMPVYGHPRNELRIFFDLTFFNVDLVYGCPLRPNVHKCRLPSILALVSLCSVCTHFSPAFDFVPHTSFIYVLFLMVKK